MEKYLYKAYNTIYESEEIFVHKQTEGNDIIEIKMYRVPISEKNREGISYSLVFVRNEERVVGYDNCEKHEKDGNAHHKHIKDKIVPYVFTDEWKLLQDFNKDVEKTKRELTQ